MLRVFHFCCALPGAEKGKAMSGKKKDVHGNLCNALQRGMEMID
jgi:hypothetical protein